MYFLFTRRLFLFSSIILILNSCGSGKRAYVSKAYRNLTAYYNTYYNAKEIYNYDLKKIELANPDHYDRLLAFYKLGDEASATGLASDMDLVIKKMSNLIIRHEKSNWVIDSYLLMGKAYYLKGDYFSALDNFGYIYNSYPNPRYQEAALIWTTRAYIKLNKQKDAQSTLDLALAADLKSIKKNTDELYSTAAFFALQTKDTSQCIHYLNKAVVGSPNKNNKIRFYFMMAQLLNYQNRPDQSILNYKKILALKPNYEVALGAKLGIASLIGIQNTKEEIALLNGYLKEERYVEFHDQIYYALAKVAQKEANISLAIVLYNKSLASSYGNTNQKGLNYEQLASIYLNEKKDYVAGSAYMDSTVTFLDKDYPNYPNLSSLRSKLADLVNNYLTIDQGDTLLILAQLDLAGQKKKIHEIVLAEIQKEKESELKAVQAYQKQLALASAQFAGSQGNTTGATPQNSYFNNAGGAGSGFSQAGYNPSASNQGQFGAQGASNNRVSGYGGASGYSGSGSSGPIYSNTNGGGGSTGAGGGVGFNSSGNLQGGAGGGPGGFSSNNTGSGFSTNNNSAGGLSGGSPFSNFNTPANTTGANNGQNLGSSYGTNPQNLGGNTGLNGGGFGQGATNNGLGGTGNANYGMGAGSSTGLSGNSPTGLSSGMNQTGGGNTNGFPNAGISNFGQNDASTGSNPYNSSQGLSPAQTSSNFGTYYGSGTGSGTFYFSNPATMTLGYNQFLQKWGNRSLRDNWRIGSNRGGNGYANNPPDSSQILRNGKEILKNAVTNPQKVEQAYLKLIPQTEPQKDSMRVKMVNAYLGNGNIFEIDLKNNSKAIQSYESAIPLIKDSTTRVQFYYNLYSLFSKIADPVYASLKTSDDLSPAAAGIKADFYKQKIIKEFPNSNYAIYFLHPETLYARQAPDTVLETYYKSTYDEFLIHQYSEVLNCINNIPATKRGNYLAPKFALLKAYSLGNTQKLPPFENELKEILKTYPKDSVAMVASTLLKSIDSNRAEISTRTFALDNSKEDNGIEIAQYRLAYLEEAKRKAQIAADLVRKNYYQADYSGPFQFFILLKSPKINYNTFRLNLSQFVEANFPNLHLKNQTRTIAGNLPVMMVSSFNDFKSVVRYYKKFEELKEDIVPLPANRYEIFFIGSGNLLKLMDADKLAIYREFFNDQMLPYTSSVAPKPIPENLINAPKSQINQTGTNPVKPITAFSTIKPASYIIVIIVKNLKSNLNPVRLKLSIFNQQNFVEQHLHQASNYIDNEFQSLSINSFSSLNQAIAYQTLLIKNKEDVIGLSDSDYDLILISPENFQKIKNRSSELDYLSFAEKNLKTP